MSRKSLLRRENRQICRENRCYVEKIVGTNDFLDTATIFSTWQRFSRQSQHLVNLDGSVDFLDILNISLIATDLSIFSTLPYFVLRLIMRAMGTTLIYIMWFHNLAAREESLLNTTAFFYYGKQIARLESFAPIWGSSLWGNRLLLNRVRRVAGKSLVLRNCELFHL